MDAEKSNLAEKAARLEQRWLESYVDDLLDRYVDPRDEFEGWTPLDASLGAAFGKPHTLAYRSESDLETIRNESRQLAIQNEFAVNAIENRISYTVGTGHKYQAVSIGEESVPESLLNAVQAVIDEFCETNRWSARQQEICRRKDRDGECFLRFFVTPESGLEIRFVEPDQIHTPGGRVDKSAYYGIRYASRGGVLDMERPAAYWIDDVEVPADQIQHRKVNVDLADPRGVPTFYPVRKNLTRAAKILRNMSTVAEIQAAIAMVRKHASGNKATIQAYASAQADATRTDGNRTQTYRRYAPGTILDTNGNTEYDFPANGIDVQRYVGALQAELRAVASRLVMPEFMLTSDASNANYSSTMVAEGPAVKMFERLQAEQIEEDLMILRRVIDLAVGQGRLPAGVLDRVRIDAQAPNVQSRDRLKEAQADQILVNAHAMSVRTMSVRHGLDPDAEQRQIEDEMDRQAGYADMLGLSTGANAASGDSSDFGKKSPEKTQGGER